MSRATLWGVFCLAAAFGPALGQAPSPLTVAVETADLGDATRVVLTFPRRVGYRLEESRARLKVLLQEPLGDLPFSRRELDGGLVKQIRIETSSDETEIVFHLGREFETFSASETDRPFKIQLLFQKKGATADEIPPPGSAAETAPDSGSQPDAAGAAEPDGSMGSIVIDPGHGGDEAGATGRGGLTEKDLVLDISRRLRSQLERSGHRAALTRDEDASLTLTARTALANHLKAPLFLSIHANSSLRDGARGAETYFLSVSGADEEAAAVAHGENASPMGDTIPAAASGEIKLVLWEMAQAEHLARSSRLAETIQAELNQLTGQKDRGVKQAPFRVLVGAAMPAALVELGFLSNSADEALFATDAYKDKVAAALASAVTRFLDADSRSSSPGQP